MPLTVFATAYDQYALKAFEAQALDYVLERVRRQLEKTPRPEPGRLAIKSGGRTVFLRSKRCARSRPAAITSWSWPAARS
jgi:DNA-binding LytR/AlgR family response regulator